VQIGSRIHSKQLDLNGVQLTVEHCHLFHCSTIKSRFSIMTDNWSPTQPALWQNEHRALQAAWHCVHPTQHSTSEPPRKKVWFTHASIYVQQTTTRIILKKIIPAEIISILLNIFMSVCVCIHIYTVSNLYSYVKNNKAKMCTNHVMHKETFSTPVRKGKNSFKGKCKNYVCLFGSLLYIDPNKLLHNT
jgi:hypothetical protein